MLDYEKLPALHQELLCNFLKPLNPNIDDLVIINCINAKLSHLLSSFRIQFLQNSNAEAKIINYYALSFAPSGVGKDKIYKELEYHIFPEFRKVFDEKSESYKDRKSAEIQLDAIKKFEDSKGEKDKIKYIQQETKAIRKLKYEITQGTQEGLNADCVAVSEAEFGSIFIKINELGMYLKNPTQTQELFINSILGAYDGDIAVTTLKSENEYSEVKNLPINCLLYSDSDELLKDTAAKSLDSLFDAGLLRRSFVAYQPMGKIKEYEYINEEEVYAYAKGILKPKVDAILNRMRPNRTLVLAEEAKKAYNNYINVNNNKYNKFFGLVSPSLLKELLGRHWKMLKLSCLLACVNHPDDCRINVQDINESIYLTEVFADTLKEFYSAEIKTDTDKLFEFFFKNIGQWITKTDIRKQKFASKNQFAKWFSDELETCADIAKAKGFELQSEQFHNNSGVKYRLVATPQPLVKADVFTDHNLTE